MSEAAKTLPDNLEEALTWWEVSKDILNLKKEIAKKYVEELKDKKDMGVGKLLIGEGKALEKYLVSENMWDKIINNIRWNIMDKFFGSVDTQSFIIGGITYNSVFDYLRPIKEKLDNAKTEAELRILEQEILTASAITTPVVTPETTTTSPSLSGHTKQSVRSIQTKDFLLPTYIAYKNLKVTPNLLSQAEIAYINEEAKYIIEKLQKQSGFPYIKEITNQQWEKILQCSGETPYIHPKAAADLVWVALLFHKKTKLPLAVSSAYRTIEHQERLKKENKKKNIPTADPGYSAHNIGLAIDIERWSRYNRKMWGISAVRKVMKMFNFSPIDSEDRHFEHKEFDKYREDREKRLDLAQAMQEKYYEDNGLSQAA